jgi:hypothetical protein
MRGNAERMGQVPCETGGTYAGEQCQREQHKKPPPSEGHER